MTKNKIAAGLLIMMSSFCFNVSAQSLNPVDFERLAESGLGFDNIESFGFSDTDLPGSFSLAEYAIVSSQDGGSCVGFAISGAMNIMHNYINDISSYDAKFVHTFDPYYLYCSVKDNDDIACVGSDCNCGCFIDEGLEIVKNYGVKKTFITPTLDCSSYISRNHLRALSPITGLYSVEDYYSLFDYEEINGEWYVSHDITDFKEALSLHYPIITGIYVESSFDKVKAANSLYSSQSGAQDGHAVTMIGYDDNRDGGSFQFVNSYGSDWGNKGFFWMTYEDYFENADRAYILYNEDWSSWTIEEEVVQNNFYRGVDAEDGYYWEGGMNEDGYFNGEGIETSAESVSVGRYQAGWRDGWWMILQNPSAPDAWRGLVLFDNGEIVDSESFGFSSVTDDKVAFTERLQLNHYEMQLNENAATSDDLYLEPTTKQVKQ